WLTFIVHSLLSSSTMSTYNALPPDKPPFSTTVAVLPPPLVQSRNVQAERPSSNSLFRTRLVPTGFTVTMEEAVYPPSTVVAVTVAVPAEIAVTSPVLLTVATLSLSELQLKLWLDALIGETEAASCRVWPAASVSAAGQTVMSVTGPAWVISIKVTLSIQPSLVTP